MSSFRTVFRDSGYLLGFRMLSRILSMVFMLFAAARLTPATFGALSFALVTVELLCAIGDLGITRYGSRELVRRWDERSLLAGRIVALEVSTSAAFVVAGLALLLLLEPGYPKFPLVLVGLLVFLVYSLVNATEAVFIAARRFFFSALFTFSGRLVYVAVGVTVLAAGGSVVLVMWGFVAAVVLEATARMVFVALSITPFSFGFDPRSLWRMLLRTIPFAAAGAASILFLRANVLILELLGGDADVGVFNVAFTLYTPFLWSAMVFGVASFTGLTESLARDPEQARSTWWQWYRLMAIAGIPLALAVTFLAGPVLSYLPAGYEESARVLQLLAWSVPPLLLASIDYNILHASDRERSAALILGIAAAANAALNFLLVPRFGIAGSAAALTGATFLREALFYRDVRRHFFRRHMAVLFYRPLLAGGAMAAVAAAVNLVNPWLAVAAGFAAYGVVIVGTGAVRLAEIRSLAGR